MGYIGVFFLLVAWGATALAAEEIGQGREVPDWIETIMYTCYMTALIFFIGAMFSIGSH